MVQLRSSRFLSCFYCGKRTAIKKDGHTRNFTCSSCDADNYLDKNGEITDPPIARTSSSRNDRYGSSLPDPFSTSSGPEASIFCRTCLKNQRLFTASIAQYDPPAHLDARAAEKHYFAYRRQMEATYPQVCSDCSTAVNQKIREARYTAQADHLRRVRDQTRKTGGGGMGSLQSLSRAGCWVWWAGWIAQGAWHLAEVARVMQTASDGLTDPDDERWLTTVVPAVQKALSLIPAHQVLSASIWLAWAGSWWNPYFVKASRGFTRHLSGFGQWYAFQALIALLRTCLRPLLELQQRSGVGGSGQQAVLVGHMATLAFSVLICRLALRSITTDTRPLFGPGSEALSSMASSAENTPPKATNTSRGFAAMLHQALDEPASNAVPSPPRGFKKNALGKVTGPNSPSQSSFSSTFMKPEPTEEYPETTDEMDWQPTASQHRAFQAYAPFSSTQPRAFGESPTTSNPSPFWYKAPAAPLHPNHRLRNTPNTHFVPRSSSQRPRSDEAFQDNSSIAFRNSKGTFGISSPTESTEQGGFAPPRFFAEERGGEEADGLADLLGSKFGLGDGSPVRGRKAPAKVGSIFQPALRTPQDSSHANKSKENTESFLSVGVFAVLWLLWISINSMRGLIPYSSQAKGGLFGLATVWNLWCLRSRCGRYRDGSSIGKTPLLSILLGAAEIAAAAWILLNLVQGRDMERWAAWVLCLMLSHQCLDNTV